MKLVTIFNGKTTETDIPDYLSDYAEEEITRVRIKYGRKYYVDKQV